MKKALLLLLVLGACPAGITQEAGTEVFAPFVSKLKATATDSTILLSWRNPADLRARPLVYRYGEQIGPDNIEQARLLARLEPGTSNYVDTPLDSRPYYYAVLLEDEKGKVYRMFVPFRNNTFEPVRITVLPSEESIAARITGILAVVVGDAVRIIFRTSRTDRDLLLFRGGSPILDSDDLLLAFSPVQLEGGTTSYLDFPIPGVEYYYAVVDAGLFKLGKKQLKAGENTTVNPVAVPMEVERTALPGIPERVPAGEPGTVLAPPTGVREERPSEPGAAASEAAPRPPSGALSSGIPVSGTVQFRPLPYLQLPSIPAEWSDRTATVKYSLPERVEKLTPQTQAALQRLEASSPLPVPPRQEVEILPEDRAADGAGEYANLRRILQEHLAKGEFGAAEEKLQGFLDIRRSPPVKARAHFYLAQAYYFQGLFEEALFELVLAQDQLYTAVQPWLQSCFRQLTSE
jgi:hypothetical protein